MKKTALLITASFSLLVLVAACDRVENGTLNWQKVQEGISYANASIKTPDTTEPKDVIIVSINPQKYDFSIFQNTSEESSLTIKEIHKQNGSLASFNGNFFTKDFKATGLLISNGQTLRKLSNAALLNGIMAIDEVGKASLINTENYDRKNFTFAIQSGPILINQNGQIAVNKDSKDASSRTAIGIDKNGNLIIVIIKQSLLNIDNEITLSDFAIMLSSSPEFTNLGLTSVLNLDGGTSSGLMIGDMYYPELTKIQNVVIVKERK